MANFRCEPLPGGHTSPAHAGTNVAGPTDWSVSDDASVDGDIIRIDVASLPKPVPGYKITNFEMALSDRNGNTTVQRVLGGPATGYVRRFRANTARNRQRVQLRWVQQRLNQIVWSSDKPNYRPQVGDAMVQASTGATATVKIAVNALASGNYFVVLDNVSGTFVDETATTVNGNPGTQISATHCTHLDAERVTLKSEWSLPRDITPAAGTPQVTITASRTTCLQGQAVVLEAHPKGFQCTRPTHDLTFRFYVEKAGEQGSHTALPDFFDSCFGAGSNNRAQGYSPVWAFAPRTSGTVTVKCEVRDPKGNTATGTLDLTVRAPVSDFAPENIYVASSAMTPVPGAPGAKLYSTLDDLIAAVPNSGDALVLLDTKDVHSPGNFTAMNFKDKAPSRLAIMPYNASGVGPDASARATLNRALTSQSAQAVVFGINLVGPFVPTDPFSITEYPEHGFNVDMVGHFSAAECNLTGWRESVKLPQPAGTAAYADLYITDYQNFGFFGGDVGKHAISGVYCFTNPRSWRAAGKSSASDNAEVGFFVDHGPYRSSRPDAARGISKSVFFSCCAWGGTGYPQPPLRWYGNGNNEVPHITYNSEILTEGGGLTINSTTRGGGDSTTHPQDFVLDKFYHLTTMQPMSCLSIGFGGTTVRNGVIATGSKPSEVVDSGVRHHIGLSNESPVPGQNDNENNPAIVEFVTVADLRFDSGQKTKQMILSEINADYPMKDVRMRNILTYAPNFTASDTGAEPVDRTARWTPLYAGQYFWDNTVPEPLLQNQTPDTSFATPSETTASYEPGPGSNGYGTAAAPVPYHDIRSRVRPSGTASRGAYDPGAL